MKEVQSGRGPRERIRERWSKGSFSSSASEKVESETEEDSVPRDQAMRRRNFQLIRHDSVQRRIAVIDDDEGIRLYLQEVLTQQGFEVFEFATAEDFLTEWDEKSKSGTFLADVALCDVRLPGLDGLSFVAELKNKAAEVPTILMTAYAEVQSAVRAIREGAYDYLEKPFDTSRLNSVLENAIRFRRLSFENRFLKNMIDPDLKLAGVQCLSPAMRAVYDQVKRIAPTDASALIQGEKGAGKAQIAQAIHENSERSEKPFLSLDCSEVPESLLEIELFGFVRGGVMPGSHRMGLLERAEGGTLFLREVNRLPFAVQAKLMRIFAEQKVRPVGSDRSVPVNVRILAATETNLAQEVKEGSFREDLFYRLSLNGIAVPPLRQRKEDIVVLAKYFLESAGQAGPAEVRSFTPAALTKLVHLPWKGNVTELKAVIDRSGALSVGGIIEEEDIPVGEVDDTEALFEGMTYDNPTLRDVERRYILSVLKKHNGKKDAAAKVLGMSRRTLYRKLTSQDEQENEIDQETTN